MIESWDDAITLKQQKELLEASVEALISLALACERNDVQKRLEIAYMDGMKLCFYPASVAKDFFNGNLRLVVEDNFSRCGSGRLFPVGGDYSPHNYYWAVQTFRLMPEFLKGLVTKLHEKVIE